MPRTLTDHEWLAFVDDWNRGVSTREMIAKYKVGAVGLYDRARAARRRGFFVRSRRRCEGRELYRSTATIA